MKSSHDLELALYEACSWGIFEAVELILEHPCVNVNGIAFTNTPLMTAVSAIRKNKDILALLLNHSDIDVNRLNRHGSSAFTIACQESQVNFARLIAMHPGFDPNVKCTKNLTQIEYARKKKLTRLVREIEAKFDL